MNIGETHNKHLLWVLEKIYKESLITRKDSPIEYWINFDNLNKNDESPNPREEAKLLEKCEEMGLIQILNRGGTWEYE